MNINLQTVLLFLATILAGLLAGFFYTWSFTIMQSLDLISESNAATAMISINANIRSGWFAAIFFGAPISILLLLITSFRTMNKGMYILVPLALVLVIATLAITFSRHIPLNNELANGASWSSYVGPWVQWNHARMITSLLAFIAMSGALTCNFTLRDTSYERHQQSVN